ncbi:MULTISPECIES: hypothetical protein [Alphaproteobacteria]|uniref:Uncharacterized protein n=2 Tax=Alphaproteobacteria TaxID=28211 RepID=A0A9W7NI99_9PROT|nr:MULTISPECIES: hypothetical protein [Rhodospirillales]KAA0679448.1 hypothetical protein DS843_16010 [Roseomonas genomospecies 6]KAA0686160.1 hypothetical protein DS837_10700 [Azospirillum brasilense]
MTYILLRRDGPSVFMAVERKSFNRRTRVATDVTKVRDFGTLGALALAGQPNVVDDYFEEVLKDIERDSAVPLIDRVWDVVSKLPQPDELTVLAVASFTSTGVPQAHVIKCSAQQTRKEIFTTWTNVKPLQYAIALPPKQQDMSGFQELLDRTTATLQSLTTCTLTFEGVEFEAQIADVYGTVYDVRHLNSAAGTPTIQSCVYDAATRMLTCQ